MTDIERIIEAGGPDVYRARKKAQIDDLKRDLMHLITEKERIVLLNRPVRSGDKMLTVVEYLAVLEEQMTTIELVLPQIQAQHDGIDAAITAAKKP